MLMKRPAALVLLLLVLAGCSGAGDRYLTEAVSIGDVRDMVPAVGRVQAGRQVDVTVPRPGRLAVLAVQPNDRVRAGQVLARLAPDAPLADREIARAELAEAEAAIREAEVRSAESRRMLDGRRNLVDRGFYSAGALATLDAAVRVDQAALDRARARADAAGLKLQRASVDLEEFVVRAPIDGVVLSIGAREGEQVGPQDATPLFVVADTQTDPVIAAEVAEPDIARVTPDVEVEFTLEAYPGTRFTGRVDRILQAPGGEGAHVFYPVLVRANSDARLFPGMTAAVEFIQTEARRVLRAPISALYFEPDDYVYQPPADMRAVLEARGIDDPETLNAYEHGFLFGQGKRRLFVEENGRWQRREVRIRAQSREHVEIVEGLKAGDRVIVGESVPGERRAGRG